MRHQRIVTYLALFVAWIAFAFWQQRDYSQQRTLIHETLHQSSHAIMTAVLGGIQSHRRLGPYFDEQLESMLVELARAKDIVAVGIVSADRKPVLFSGSIAQSRLAANFALGDGWTADGFRLVQDFQLPESTPGPGPATGGGGGRGLGFGGWWRDAQGDASSRFEAGKHYYAILILDRARADTLARRTAWIHSWAVAAAFVVAVCLAILWNVMINLAETRGRARVIETEMRHLRDLNQAAAGLAHETRNPLGLIRGWTQRLAEPDIPDDRRRQITKTMMEECDRVTARINQFLTFARPRSPTVQSVSLAHLTNELAIILQPDLEENDLHFDRAIADNANWVEADPDLLRQALFNLIQNAIQFSPPGETIRLRTARTRDGTTCLEVIDRGPGVKPEHVESLFTPYFTTRAEGTGLGLAIVRHIAKLHEWNVNFRPDPDRGTVFYLCGIHVAEPIHDSDR